MLHRALMLCCFVVFKCVLNKSFTIVMVLRAVSAPMLKSDPGTLLDTVAGTTTSGIHSSSYFSLACTNCRPPINAYEEKTVKEVSVVLVYVLSAWQEDIETE